MAFMICNPLPWTTAVYELFPRLSASKPTYRAGQSRILRPQIETASIDEGVGGIQKKGLSHRRKKFRCARSVNQLEGHSVERIPPPSPNAAPLYLPLNKTPGRCASGCAVECWICNREVAGSNLSLGYFAPRSTQPSILRGR